AAASSRSTTGGSGVRRGWRRWSEGPAVLAGPRRACRAGPRLPVLAPGPAGAGSLAIVAVASYFPLFLCRRAHKHLIMDAESLDFLKRLLDTPGPSGFEAAPARVWRAEAEKLADRVDVDVSGNSVAVLNEGGTPRVMLAGHIDEIGLMVTHVDEEGFVYFDGIGGWDPQVLVGQRVRLLTKSGEVVGVIGRKPIHLIKGDEREKAVKLKDLWIDVGASGRAAASAKGIRVGDPAVLEGPVVELGDGLIVSRSIDNRVGAVVVLEALRLLAEDRPRASVAAVATAQEEIGYSGGGARTCAFRLD